MENIQTLIDLRRWQELEEVLDKELTANHGDGSVCIEALYLLQLTLVNGAYLPKTEFHQVHELLQKVFQKSYTRFLNNPDYLFFVGYFIALCDWCFGQDGLKLSHEMLKRATNLDPSNLVFRWGYSFSTNQTEARELSVEITQSADIQAFLNSYGRAGEYISEQIRNLPYFLTLPKG